MATFVVELDSLIGELQACVSVIVKYIWILRTKNTSIIEKKNRGIGRTSFIQTYFRFNIYIYSNGNFHAQSLLWHVD